MIHKNILLAVAAVMVAATGFTFLRAATVAPKGYVVAEITVTDPEAYKQYAATVPPIAAKFSEARSGETAFRYCPAALT